MSSVSETGWGYSRLCSTHVRKYLSSDEREVFLGGMSRNVISELLRGRKRHFNLDLAVMTERYQHARNLDLEEK